MTLETKTDRVKTGDPNREVRTTQPRELLSLAFAESLPAPLEQPLSPDGKTFWKGEITLNVRQGSTLTPKHVEVELRAPAKQEEDSRLDLVLRTGLTSEDWVIKEDTVKHTIIIGLETFSASSVLSPQAKITSNPLGPNFRDRKFSAVLCLKTPRKPSDKITAEDIDLQRSQPHFNIPLDMLMFKSPQEAINILANLATAIKATMQSTED